jgi:xanthine dehydrogenase accessory factor
MNINKSTSLVLTTRGSAIDIAGLPALLETKAGYIGVIGSRRRWASTVKGLNDFGISDEMLEHIHSPLGIGIGAETPEEIAVSILAEVIMIQKGGSGRPMQEPR